MRLSRKIRAGLTVAVAMVGLMLGGCSGSGNVAADDPTSTPTNQAEPSSPAHTPSTSPTPSPTLAAPTPVATPTLPSECKDIVHVDEEAGEEVPEECPTLTGEVVLLKTTRDEDCDLGDDDDDEGECLPYTLTVAVIKLSDDAGLNIYSVELSNTVYDYDRSGGDESDLEWLDACKPGTKIRFTTGIFPSTFRKDSTSFKILTNADVRRLKKGATGKISHDMIGRSFLIALGYNSGRLERI